MQYNVKAKASDNAGNSTESNVTTITTKNSIPAGATSITFTNTPTAWTNGNVTVTISTTSTEYTIQYQINSTTGTWQNYTASLTATTNETIYARLWDGTNSGTYTTLDISNIDKTVPTTTAPTLASTTSTVTATNTQTDAGSGIASTQYAIKKTSDSTWGAWQDSNKFTGLLQTTGYSVKTKSTDKAGNSSESAVASVTTGTVPEGVKNIAYYKGTGEIVSTTGDISVPDDNNKDVIVPANYKVASDSATSIDGGVVLEDTSGNQYVWVEVPKTATVYPTAGLSITGFSDDEYTKIETDLHTYTSTYRNGTAHTDTCDSTNQTGLTSTDYNATKKAMLKSIYQNGGFWVGRYEAGIGTNRTGHTTVSTAMVTKANQYPYTYVTCSESETLAKALAPSGYNSSLLFGVQWDLVLKYMETKGATVAELNSDSKSWGNYYNNTYNITSTLAKYSTNSGSSWTATPYNKTVNGDTLLTTGASSTFSKNNIYDIAGNVWEWTMEYTSDSSNPCALRGGVYGDRGSALPASDRYNNVTSGSSFDLGFRVTLY